MRRAHTRHTWQPHTARENVSPNFPARRVATPSDARRTQHTQQHGRKYSTHIFHANSTAGAARTTQRLRGEWPASRSGPAMRQRASRHAHVYEWSKQSRESTVPGEERAAMGVCGMGDAFRGNGWWLCVAVWWCVFGCEAVRLCLCERLCGCVCGCVRE